MPITSQKIQSFIQQNHDMNDDPLDMDETAELTKNFEVLLNKFMGNTPSHREKGEK